jgi:hypothetical protein
VIPLGPPIFSTTFKKSEGPNLDLTYSSGSTKSK